LWALDLFWDYRIVQIITRTSVYKSYIITYLHNFLLKFIDRTAFQASNSFVYLLLSGIPYLLVVI
jgi:hypothetical protein